MKTVWVVEIGHDYEGREAVAVFSWEAPEREIFDALCANRREHGICDGKRATEGCRWVEAPKRQLGFAERVWNRRGSGCGDYVSVTVMTLRGPDGKDEP